MRTRGSITRSRRRTNSSTSRSTRSPRTGARESDRRRPPLMDDGRLRALLDRIAKETGELRRIARFSDDELEADPDRLAAAKYRLVVAIEAAIDAGELVIGARD